MPDGPPRHGKPCGAPPSYALHPRHGAGIEAADNETPATGAIRRNQKGVIMNSISKGMLIAGAAASLLLSGSVTARADEKMGGDIYCSGINSCKGQGACAGGGHGCAGKNSCKGQGVTKTTKADCDAKHGTVVPDPHPAK